MSFEMNDKPRLIEKAFPLKQTSLDSVHEEERQGRMLIINYLNSLSVFRGHG